MNYYVEIPYACVHGLVFPNLCPFTLDENPNREWEVAGHTDRGPALALPGVPVMIVREHKFIFRVPASGRFVRLQSFLTLLVFGLGVVFCGALVIGMAIPSLEKIPGVPEVIGAILVVAILAYLWKRWSARNVWIDYVGDEFVEVVFKRKSYVELFCRSNSLTFRQKFFNFRMD